ncbi:MAG: HD domain-containing protein [Endomicrobia bacterium]|nr:HD domain-containing protein [Endomicrobiia bacterium]
MRQNDKIQLVDLVDMSEPFSVLEEVKNNFIYHYHIGEFLVIRQVFRDFIDLMEGRYPGYQKCNTKFHDIQHATDAFLAMSRLIDGYNIKNYRRKFSVENVKVALIAALYHDVGYVQKVEETQGTGAKYTFEHVDRSIEFIKNYLSKNSFSQRDIQKAVNMISCTEIRKDVNKIKFSDNEEKTLGFMLATADYLGQMSSRNYLEKLVFLYYEFKEGGVTGYSSEYDLVKKTKDFYLSVRKELDTVYEKVYKYATYHFKKRYKINENLYLTAINRAMEYLQTITSPEEMQAKLRRKV